MKYQANTVEVEAYFIVGVSPTKEDGSFEIHTKSQEDSPEAIFSITPDMAARMHPSVGDYLVIQSDGYQYLNPKNVFERKYSKIAG